MNMIFSHLQPGTTPRGRTHGVASGNALCVAAWSLTPLHRVIETARNLSSRRIHRRSCAGLLLAALLGMLGSGNARAQELDAGAGTITIQGTMAYSTNAYVLNGGMMVFSNSASISAGYVLAFNTNNYILNTNFVISAPTNTVSLIGTGTVFAGGTLVLNNTIFTNGLRLFIGGYGTNTATVTLSSGTNSFANGLVISGNSILTNSATLITPVLTLNGSSIFSMNGGFAMVNVVTNGGTFIQNGGIFDPAFYDNTGTFTLLSGTNQDTVFLNRASGTVNHSGGTVSVSGGGVLNGTVTGGDPGSSSQLTITNGG